MGSLDELVKKMHQKPNIDAIRDLLQSIHHPLINMYYTGTAKKVCVNIYVIAYFMVMHPAKLYDNATGTFHSILSTAKTLLETFESIIAQYMERGGVQILHVDIHLRKLFCHLVFDFIDQYKLWRVQYDAKVVVKLKATLVKFTVELMRVENEEGSSAIEFKNEIKRGLTTLRQQLLRLIGKEKMAEFDEEQAKQCQTAKLLSDTPSEVMMISKERLVHELMVDASFQVPQYDEPISIEYRSKIAVLKTCMCNWDELRKEVGAETPCYNRVWVVLKNIKEILLLLDQSENSEQWNGVVCEILDLDHIKARLSANAFHYDDFIRIVSDVDRLLVQNLRCPVNQDMRQKYIAVERIMHDAIGNVEARANALAKGLEYLFGKVSAVHIDNCNARLKMIAPLMKNYGIGYATDKFDADLKAGSIQLTKTVAFVLNAIERGVHSQYIHWHNLKCGNAKEYEKVLGIGFCYMLLNAKGPEDIPETFRFDKQRIHAFGKNFDAMASIASILAGLKFHIKHDENGIMDKVAERIQFLKIDYIPKVFFISYNHKNIFLLFVPE